MEIQGVYDGDKLCPVWGIFVEIFVEGKPLKKMNAFSKPLKKMK